MIANFFSLGDRNYLNNAVVIAHALDVIFQEFKNVTKFNIKFKKPFNTKGNYTTSEEPIDGYTTGSFYIGDSIRYFSYNPTDIPLENEIVSSPYFDIFLNINNLNRDAVIQTYISEIGPMVSDDKAIFVRCDIPDTSIVNDAVANKIYPEVLISDVTHIGSSRFKTSVFLDGKFFSNRYTTIGKFVV